MIGRIKSPKDIAQVSRFHKGISRFSLDQILRHIEIVVLWFFLDVIKLDTVLGLLGEFLNALNMRAEFIDGEFGVLLGEDHGFDQVE
jgi:hypothetical protein